MRRQHGCHMGLILSPCGTQPFPRKVGERHMATRKPTKNVRPGKRTKKPTKSRVATMSTRTGMAVLTPKQALAALPVVDKRPNTMFPGLPNYTGPIYGYFAMLHHQQLFEKTHHQQL